eukprot:scaffold4390_cov264-Pinguiococcus_pyrenoidosus.AAC.1
MPGSKKVQTTLTGGVCAAGQKGQSSILGFFGSKSTAPGKAAKRHAPAAGASLPSENENIANASPAATEAPSERKRKRGTGAEEEQAAPKREEPAPSSTTGFLGDVEEEDEEVDEEEEEEEQQAVKGPRKKPKTAAPELVSDEEEYEDEEPLQKDRKRMKAETPKTPEDSKKVSPVTVSKKKTPSKAKKSGDARSRGDIEAPSWEAGSPVPYAALVEVFEAVEEVSGRLEIQDLVCNFQRQVVAATPEDLASTVFLFCNQVAPSFENVELGIGDSLIIKAISEATGRNQSAIKEQFRATGDLGLVAQNSRSNQRMLSFGAKPKPYTARQILDKLRGIAKMSGNKSQDRKVGEIKRMLVSSQGSEAKYIVRALQGRLRIGCSEKT